MYLLLCLVLAWQSPPLVISGPTQVEPYRLVRLSVPLEIQAGSVAWFVYPRRGVDWFVGQDTRTFLFVGPPGTYQIDAASFASGQVQQAGIEVTIGGATPKPDPQPDPPKPQPSPFAAPFRVVLIVDPGQPEPKVLTDLLVSATLRPELAKRSASWRVLTTNSKWFTADWRAFLTDNGLATPIVILCDSANRMVASWPTGSVSERSILDQIDKARAVTVEALP